MTSFTASDVQQRLVELHRRIHAAKERSDRTQQTVELLVATKYVALEQMKLLADCGITRVGENRAQALVEKYAQYGATFQWDFIGHLQSRKVKMIAPIIDRVHSLSSQSALAELERYAKPTTEVFIEVNIAGETTKSGVGVTELPSFISQAQTHLKLTGLMTMPPATANAEENRHWFRLLRQLADEHGLQHCSMGTSQDFEVAIEEGATIVRLGSCVYEPIS